MKEWLCVVLFALFCVALAVGWALFVVCMMGLQKLLDLLPLFVYVLVLGFVVWALVNVIHQLR